MEESERKETGNEEALVGEVVPTETAASSEVAEEKSTDTRTYEEIQAEAEKASGYQRKEERKKTISNVIFLLALTILVITLFLSFGELEEIGETIMDIGQDNNWVWLFGAFGCAAVYFLLWPLGINLFGRASDAKASFSDAYLIGCSEHFYNGVTPFAAGGQPFQVYSFAKCGVDPSKATGIVLANFTTYMFVTNLFAIVALFFYGDFTSGLPLVSEQLGVDMTWFGSVAIVGFALNFLVFLFMISLGVSKTCRKIIYWLFDTLCKIKWVNRLFGKKRQMLVDYCENAQTSFKEIFTHWLTFIVVALLKIVMMAAYYAIPFFVMKSCGINPSWEDFILILFATSFAITTVVWLPTPGGTGGMEYVFAIVIASTVAAGFGQSQAVSLLWRLITYYFIMLVSFAFSSILEARTSRRLKEETSKNGE